MRFKLRTQDFTEAARAIGASGTRILIRHLIPNSRAPVIVAATLAEGGAISLRPRCDPLAGRLARRDDVPYGALFQLPGGRVAGRAGSSAEGLGGLASTP